MPGDCAIGIHPKVVAEQRVARFAGPTKYRALSDAFAELGKPDQVRGLFVGFQRHLYSSGLPIQPD